MGFPRPAHGSQWHDDPARTATETPRPAPLVARPADLGAGGSRRLRLPAHHRGLPLAIGRHRDHGGVTKGLRGNPPARALGGGSPLPFASVWARVWRVPAVDCGGLAQTAAKGRGDPPAKTLRPPSTAIDLSGDG